MLVGEGRDDVGVGRWDRFQCGDVRGETINLSKEMNESRDKQRTHVLRDLPSTLFASGGGRCWSCPGWRCVAIP